MDVSVSQWDPEKVGTTVVLITFIVLVIRTAITRKWVPGAYFEDMRADRDAARTEAKQAVDMLAKLQIAHAEVLYQNSELVRIAGAQNLHQQPHGNRLPHRQRAESPEGG